MYCELPEFRRCCLCLPLRRGILVFAYINIILLILQIAVFYAENVDDLNMIPLRSVDFQMPVVFSTVLCVWEIFANIVLIFGAHTKRILYINVFYYFTMTMMVASLLSEILSTFRYRNDETFIIYFIFCLIINLYLLFLVRSLIVKLQMAVSNQFNNRLADLVKEEPRHVYVEIVTPKDNETV